MTEHEDDPRFDEIQREIDEVRARLPKDPGLGIPDPDIQPVVADEDMVDPPI